MPYGNQSVTTGSRSSVRRVNTPYDLGTLDVRQLLSIRGRLGAMRCLATTPHGLPHTATRGRHEIREHQRELAEAHPLPHRARALTPATHHYPPMQALNRPLYPGFSRTPFDPGLVPIRALYLTRGRLGDYQTPPALRSSRYPSRTPRSAWDRGPLAGRYAGNGGRRLGQVAEIATAATSLAPTIASISQLFGPGASGADAERQAHMYSLYEQAMTSPGSPSSIDAVVNLYTTATQQYDPIARVQQNNPQITRTYAQQALQQLSTQGWINVNSLSPSYTGIGASGVVYAPTSSTGMNTETAVAQTPLPRGNAAAVNQGYGGGYGTGASGFASVSGSPLLLLGVLGLGAILILRR